MHSSPCTAHAAIVTALSPGYSWVKTYSCTLSGQLIMDFDYSHFVLLSAAPSPTGGPAERPAPLIVSVSGLIEPNGNGCCQSSLFSSVYMLIHQRDIHYRLAENSSRHTHIYSNFLVILIKGWSSQWSAHTAGPADASGNWCCFLMVLGSSSQSHYFYLCSFLDITVCMSVQPTLAYNCIQVSMV